MSRMSIESTQISPLERFVRDYVEAREGVWDEIEPQVYDLLVGNEMLEVAFDPEALPEHPQAQLATLGSPLIDQLLNDAVERWSTASFYRVGLNLRPHDLDRRIRRSLSLPSDVSVQFGRVRAMHFPQAAFWFKATFTGDQKEDAILPVAIDLHYLRQVRQLDSLLASHRMSLEPESPLPHAPHRGLKGAYDAARRSVAPTAASLANARRREWSGRMAKQIARMSGYYQQLREEAGETMVRTADPAETAQRMAARREAIDREEALRIAELRQKSAVKVSVRLNSLLVVHQPKLLVFAELTHKGRKVGSMEIVWDALTEAVEAPPCPACRQPTFELRLTRTSLCCGQCQTLRIP